jgi:hypothetical protein
LPTSRRAATTSSGAGGTGSVRQERATPRPEIFRRKVATGDLAQVGVHLGRVDALDGAVRVDVLEQRLTG